MGLDSFAGSLAIHGMISLERGFIFTSMILAAIGVFLIEKRSLGAARARDPSVKRSIEARDFLPSAASSARN